MADQRFPVPHLLKEQANKSDEIVDIRQDSVAICCLCSAF